MENEALSIFSSHILPLLNIISTPGAAIIMWLIARKSNHRENALKEQIRLLTEIPLTLKDDGVFYTSENIPFCPGCYGKGGHKVPIRKNNKSDEYICPIPACLAYYSPKYAKQS